MSAVKMVRTIIHLNKYGSSMGTRELGSSIREEVLSLINQGNNILFDFSGVSVISSAFGDELFGKLYIELGEEIFKNKIKVNNFDNEESKEIILLIINNGINYRKNNLSQ
ncbi:MAG: STAS-like domain-containing protein [Candidatus Omnitrophota bacterium]